MLRDPERARVSGPALFRVALGSGEVRWARGTAANGPSALLPREFSLDAILARSGPEAAAALAAPAETPLDGPCRVLAPIESQEVWAAGVTYIRSRDARLAESSGQTAYDRAYTAERPELFFKSAAWRVRGPGDPIGVRRDSTWDVPEPELALVLAADMTIVGYVLADDVSSREIEGENVLYLPQAKTFDGACAVGPCIVPAAAIAPPFGLLLEIRRAGELVFEGATSTDRMAKSLEHLAGYLGRALSFPSGAILLTGTGVVPEPPYTLLPGDEVRISSEELGTLVNVAEAVGGVGPTGTPRDQ